MSVKALYAGLVALAAATSACTSETDSNSTQGLHIQLQPLNDGLAPCQIERTAVVDQTSHSLYMIRGTGVYQLENGRANTIPVQIQFRGMEGVVVDEAVTMPDLDGTCIELGVEFRIESCVDHERKDVECPPIQVSGQEAFRAFSLKTE